MRRRFLELIDMYGSLSLIDWNTCNGFNCYDERSISCPSVFSIFTASTLQFDDGEKKIKYETILFQEVHSEIIELKVVPPSMTCS